MSIRNKQTVFLGEEIPNDILIILENSGFDSLFLLETIDENDLSEIEEYFKCNPSKLKGTKYEKMSDFKLKPGHRKFMLGLPKRIEKINEKKHTENAVAKHSDFAYTGWFK